MGWYAGTGGRLMFTSGSVAGVQQPIPAPDSNNGNLIECKWNPSYTLKIPGSWTTGVYLTKLTGSTKGYQSYIIFVVRANNPAPLLFVSSVTTYQAYNNWGGKSLYDYNSGGAGQAAKKVSFNRPYGKTGDPYYVGSGDFIAPPVDQAIGWEYNMVRFIEREGYDVSYITSIDEHEDPKTLTRAKAILSVGHDEYWSWQMRANVTAARDKGVDLGFFSANVCYWQIRLEVDSAGNPDRTQVCYKLDAPTSDPMANTQYITTLWRRNPVLPPEDALVGVMYTADPVHADMIITNPGHWSVAGTGLTNGTVLPGIVGYEADATYTHQPAGTQVIAHSPFSCPGDLPPGESCPAGGALMYSDMVSYQAPSGATVFATGTMQWSWGLDNFRSPLGQTNPAVQQITRNVLARFLQ